MKKAYIKVMAGMLAIVLLLVSAPVAFASEQVSIVSVYSANSHSIAEPVKVLATIPENAENVTLKVGNESLVTTVSDSVLGTTGKKIVSGVLPSNILIGDYSLTLSAMVDGNQTSDESTITLRKYDTTVTQSTRNFDGLYGKTDAEVKTAINFGGTEAFCAVGDGYYLVNSDTDGTNSAKGLGMYVLTANKWNRFPYASAGAEAPFNPAVLEMDFDVYLNKIGPAVWVKFYQYERENIRFFPESGEDAWYNLPVINADGTLFGTNVDVETGVYNTVTVKLNRTTSTYEVFVNGERTSGGTFAFFEDPNVAKCVHRMSIRASVSADKEEEVRYDNVLFKTTTEFPVSKRLSYVTDDGETEASDASVPMGAQNIKLTMTDTDLTDVTGNVILRKKSGEAVTATATVDGNVISIVPDNPLSDKTDYEIVIGKNVKYKSKTYGYDYVVPFTSFAEFSVLSPSENQIASLGDNIACSVTAPTDTTVKVYIDNVEKASGVSVNGIVNLSLPTAGLSSGRKTVRVLALFENGTSQTILKNISLNGFVRKDYFKQNFNSYTSGTIKPEGVTTNWYMANSKGSYIAAKNYEMITGESAETGDKAYQFLVTPTEVTDTSKFPFVESSDGMVCAYMLNEVGYTDTIKRTGNIAIMEFDVMFPNVSDYGLCVRPTHWKATQIIRNGSCVDNTPVVANDWMHVKVVDDFSAATAATDKATRTVYIDGRLVKTVTDISNDENAKTEYVKISLVKETPWTAADIAAGETTAFAIDNIEVYTLTGLPNVESIAYSKSEAVSEVTQLVPCDADNIQFTFDGDFDATTISEDGKVRFYVNDEQVSAAVAFDAATKKLTVTPAANSMTEYSDAKIVIDKTVNILSPTSSYALGNDYEVCFKIGDSENCFYRINLEKGSSNIAGNFEIINESGAQKALMVMMSSFKNSFTRLTGVDYEKVKLDSGKAVVKTVVQPLTESTQFRAFLWTDDLVPIIKLTEEN